MKESMLQSQGEAKTQTLSEAPPVITSRRNAEARGRGITEDPHAKTQTSIDIKMTFDDSGVDLQRSVGNCQLQGRKRTTNFSTDSMQSTSIDTTAEAYMGCFLMK